MINVLGTLQAPGMIYTPPREVKVIDTAMRKGALVTHTRGTSTASLFTTGDGTVPILGLTNHSVSSSATATAEISLIGTGTLLEIDIKEVLNKTALTLTGGATTNITDSSIIMGVNDLGIGAVFEILTCAAGASVVGTQITATDYTSSSGVFSCSAIAAAMASGDTVKLLSLSNTWIWGWAEPLIDGTYADAIYIDGTAAGKWCRVLGTDSTGKKLHVVVTKGYDAVSETVCSDTY